MAEPIATHRLVSSALAYLAPRLDPADIDAELTLTAADLPYLAASISLASGVDIPERDVMGLRTVRQLEAYLASHHR